MSKYPILVEGKSSFWHQLYSEAHRFGLKLEEAKQMGVGELTAWIGANKQYDSGPVVEQKNLFAEAQDEKRKAITDKIKLAMNAKDLRTLWDENPRIQKDEWFLKPMKERKEFLIDEGYITIQMPKEDYKTFNDEKNEPVKYHNEDSVPF